MWTVPLILHVPRIVWLKYDDKAIKSIIQIIQPYKQTDEWMNKNKQIMNE